MNGAILGLTQDQIDSRFEEIASFADIGSFIEQPVKTYSSGMFVRLAFASNIMSRPEIMIVDEALSVGDMNFQAKCMTALTRIQDNGATILFVSHDVGSVKSLCSRGVYLERGQLVTTGRAADVAELYVRTMREEMNEEHRKFARVSAAFDEKPALPVESTIKSADSGFKRSAEFEKRVAQFRYGSGEVKVTSVDLLDSNGEDLTFVDFNQKVSVKVYFEAFAEKTVSVNFSVFDEKKNNIIGCGFVHADQSYLVTKEGGQYLAEFSLKLPLQEGNYSVRINISSPIVENESAEFVDFVSDAVVFKVGRWEKSRVWSKVHAFSELKLHEFEV
jgi:lipopolysaccharide transport system ATP-binding protein